jgi:hypothetical protein
MATYLRNWARAFDEDRQMSFALDSRIEEPQPFYYGLPQGSLVSPILFLVYADAALESTGRAGAITNTSYVDDISIVAASPKPDVVVDIWQTHSNKHLHRVESLCLSLAPKSYCSCPSAANAVLS